MPIEETLRPAIRELQLKLEKHQKEATETKKAINVLHSMLGLPPMYTEVEEQASQGLQIAPDQFFKKSIASAAREYMRQKGSAATVDELVDVLRRGGCSLGTNPAKNVRISLTKNSGIFVVINDETFGLWEKYGGRPKTKKIGVAVGDSLATGEQSPAQVAETEDSEEEALDEESSSAPKAENPA